MHIGISTSVIQRGQSGIAQYVFALCRALIEHDEHEFSLFALDDDLELFRFTAGKMRLIAVNEKYRRPLKNIFWHQAVLPGLARKLQLDVLHIPSYRRLLWPRPCPLVATIHDLAPFRFRGKYSWLRMFYGRAVVPQLARNLDQIITVSDTTARDVLKFLKLPRKRLTVIHNGVDHTRFFPGNSAQAKAAVAHQYGLTKPYLLYVARLEHPAKNHTRLIAAFDRFKAAQPSNWQLAFAGKDWHGADTIHDAVRKSPFASEIRSLGFVADDTLPDLYRAADIFVYPSLFEGFGMPPIEAMACGCPVISSDRDSLGEILGEAAIRVDPENLAALATQFCAVSSSESMRQRLREAGFSQARQFDWALTAATTVKIYEKAAAPNANISHPHLPQTLSPR